MLLEERRYATDPEFARDANAQPDIYERDWEEFWETEGRTRVTWFEPFRRRRGDQGACDGREPRGIASSSS
jgi:hypothetical protein